MAGLIDNSRLGGNKKHQFDYLTELRGALNQNAERTIEQMLEQMYGNTKQSSWSLMTNPKILLPILATFLSAGILTAEKKRKED